jgi:regulator of replication initiation timing
MKIDTINKFQKIEKEIKKMIFHLNSVKDENSTLKKRLNELEKFKNSVSKNIVKSQKVTSEYDNLKNNYNKLLREKELLRKKVDQMLRKLDSLQLY